MKYRVTLLHEDGCREMYTVDTTRGSVGAKKCARERLRRDDPDYTYFCGPIVETKARKVSDC